MVGPNMKQWITDKGEFNTVNLQDVPIPSVGRDEVLVRVHAFSLNYRDVEVCEGTYGHHAGITQVSKVVPCSDMVGTVVSSNSPSWTPGRRVMSTFNQNHLTGPATSDTLSSGLGLPNDGVATEYRIFPSYGLVATPDYLSDEQACCLPIAAVTAWMAINTFNPINSPARDIQTEKWILCQGTGGVSVSAAQIGLAAGFKIIITSSSDGKIERVKDLLGSKHVHGINYKHIPEWSLEVMTLTNGKGADIIIENGGASTLSQSFDCVAFGGTISAIGYLGGKLEVYKGGVHTNLLALRRNVTLKGLINGPRDRFEEMLRFYEEFNIEPVVDKVFRYEQFREALQYVKNAEHISKVVVKVAS